jgi:hypothetical protein
VDFIFFTDCFLNFEYPGNIQFIPITLREFNVLATQKTGIEINIEKPYKICDLRPAFGVILQEYLTKYDYWIYSDIDVIYGNIRAFLTEEILSEYEVISARNEYMVGSFSAFRNNEKINTLFLQSADLKKVFSDQNAYFFDEAGYECWNVILYPDRIKTYPSNIDTITHIVNRNANKGTIKALFKTMVKERLELSLLNKNPWTLHWDKGKLTSFETNEECLYFHLIGYKDDKNFVITKDASSERLWINPKGIFTSENDIRLKATNNMINELPDQELNIVIVIPCYNEPDLLKTLESLFHCDRPKCAMEVIIVINSPENADSPIILQNLKSYKEVGEWIGTLQDDKIKFHALFFPALSMKYAGVGMARKLGMDEAYRRLNQVGNPEGIIVCLDADCTVAQNYLTAIEEHFNSNKETPGCDIYFEHPLDESIDEDLIEGTAFYELKLRYEVNFGDARNINPYFHFVGFAMAARAWAYEKAGGMVMYRSGEDLAFIAKIRQLGGLSTLKNTTIFPATRLSQRTARGSASVITFFMKDYKSPVIAQHALKMDLSPDPDSLQEFHFNQALFPVLFEMSNESNPMQMLSAALKDYLLHNNIPLNYEVLTSIKKHYPTLHAFSVALNNHLFPLNGQYYHGQHFQLLLNDEYYPPLQLTEACVKLLSEYFGYDASQLSVREILDVFRAIDKEGKPALLNRNKSWNLNEISIKLYTPKKTIIPEKMLEVESAWKGLEQIIEDILDTFQIERKNCIEFGVEFGYSAVVFSNYFVHVTGIDTFKGDIHTLHKKDHYLETRERLSAFENIELANSDYKDWISKDKSRYNLAHVDIVHNYEETFECGFWSATHSDCTIFHDTESFPEVKRAVMDIARATGQQFYNYPYFNGLGILVSVNK